MSVETVAESVVAIVESLAVSRVEWKTGGARGHSIITWHKDGQVWRIVSMYHDEHFMW